MLGKLIKNEFKTSWQPMSGIYFAAAITALIMLVFLTIKSGVITIIGGLALNVIAFVSIVMTIVMVIQNYSRTMFGAQGYLTLTLPVKSSHLLFSKTIVAFAWVFISSAFVAAISAFNLFYSLAQVSDNIKSFATQIYDLLNQLKAIPNLSTLKVPMIAIIIMLFILLLSLVCRVYFAITFAHTKFFQKLNPTFAAILIFFGIMIISVLLFIWGFNHIPMAIVIVDDSVYLTFTKGMLESVFSLSPNHPHLPIGEIIFPIITSIILYFSTSYLIRKKINIR